MIVGLDITTVEMELKEPQFMGRSSSRGRQPALFVRVRLDDDAVGFGEFISWPYFGGETLGGATEVIAFHLAGQTVGRDESEWRQIRRDFDDALPGNKLAKTAVEVAVLDAFCRSRNIPLRALFGASKERKVELSYSVSAQDLTEERCLVEEKLARGYSIFKMKVGVCDPEDDAKRLQQLRALAPGSAIRVDYNTAATDEHLKVLQTVADRIEIDFCEQPFPAEQLGRLERLRRWFTIPLSLDESIQGPADVQWFGTRGLMDVASMKLAKMGGPRGLLECLEVAEREGVAAYHGALSDSPLNVAVAMSMMSTSGHVVRGSDYYFAYDILDASAMRGGPIVRDGVLSLAGAPGHGVEPPIDWFKDARQFGLPE